MKTFLRKLAINLFVGNHFGKIGGRLFSPVRIATPIQIVFIGLIFDYYKFESMLEIPLFILLLILCLMPWIIKGSLNLKYSELGKNNKFFYGGKIPTTKEENKEYLEIYDYYVHETPDYFQVLTLIPVFLFLSILGLLLFFNL